MLHEIPYAWINVSSDITLNDYYCFARYKFNVYMIYVCMYVCMHVCIYKHIVNMSCYYEYSFSTNISAQNKCEDLCLIGGRVDYSGGETGKEHADFYCDRHWQLFGATSADCLSNGKWSNPMPSCLGKYHLICSLCKIARIEENYYQFINYEMTSPRSIAKML